MRYFEIDEPYYAMIKAENENNALKLYAEVVVDTDDSTALAELESGKALVKFSQSCGGSDDYLFYKEGFKTFIRDEEEVLLIDRSLI